MLKKNLKDSVANTCQDHIVYEVGELSSLQGSQTTFINVPLNTVKL